MTIDSEKRKITIEAAESQTTFIPVENHFTVCQCCLLCENTREFIDGCPSELDLWVCDECKEAIAFVKKQLKRDPLKPILD